MPKADLQFLLSLLVPACFSEQPEASGLGGWRRGESLFASQIPAAPGRPLWELPLGSALKSSDARGSKNKGPFCTHFPGKQTENACPWPGSPPLFLDKNISITPIPPSPISS